MKLLSILIILLSLVRISHSETYWISSTGEAANIAACSGATPLSGTDACNYDLANGSGVVADDVVYYRAGTYSLGSDTFIQPYNSGTSGHPITFMPYSDEVVNVVGTADEGNSSFGIWINAKSYIKVTGTTLGQLNFTKMGENLVIGPSTGTNPTGDSSYNEISYVYFGQSFLDASWGGWDWQGSVIWKQAYYNHIHHCEFEEHGTIGTDPSSADGNMFDIGMEDADASNERTYYNVLEYNEFGKAGHATLGMMGEHNVVRNNYFHNEPWFDTLDDEVLYGYRNIISDGNPGYVGYNLVEGNRIGWASPLYNDTAGKGGQGLKLGSSYNIVRFNSFIANQGTPFSFYPQTATYDDSNYNYVYNNTVFANGYYAKPGSEVAYYDTIVWAYNGTTTLWDRLYHNALKNNLFYINANIETPKIVWIPSGGQTVADAVDPAKGNNIIANNLNGGLEWAAETDPMFVNESHVDATSLVLPNLNLQGESPALDGGSYLTQANGSGSSSEELVVDDARYFQDGNFGTGSPLAWPSSVTMAADYIAVGTIGNTVQISSIDYDTNTITLASAISWADNAPVWLYKDSDGTVVLSGSAPDYGAYEYDQDESPDTTAPATTITTSDPTNITLDSLVVNHTTTDAVGVTSCKSRLESAPDASNGSACVGTSSCLVTGFAEGANNLYIGCTDAAANWGDGDSIVVNYTPAEAGEGGGSRGRMRR